MLIKMIALLMCNSITQSSLSRIATANSLYGLTKVHIFIYLVKFKNCTLSDPDYRRYCTCDKGGARVGDAHAVHTRIFRECTTTTELSGLVVGVSGLAGLCSVCLEAVRGVDTYKDFELDSQLIVALFESDKYLFERWPRCVDLKNQETVWQSAL